MTMSPEHAEPLKLPPAGQGWARTFWIIFGAVALSAILVACAVYTAPALVTDWQIRAAARPASAAQVSDGKCSTKIVLHICDMTLTLLTPAATVTRRVNYVFTGVQIGDFSVQTMADPARPDLITTDLGLDRLWNRTITLAVLMALLAGAVIAIVVSLIRNRRSAA